jgi:hypothetical protein
MMFLALALGLLWTCGILMAVVLCVASRRIDEDLASGRSTAPRRRSSRPVRARHIRVSQVSSFR